MSSLRTVWLVARRELRERVASRAFQISTALTVVLVLGLLLAPTLFGLDEPPDYTIGVVGDQPAALVASIEAAAPREGTTATLREYADRSALDAAVLDGDVDIGVVGGATIVDGPGTDPQLTTLVTGVLATTGIQERADALGLSPADVAQLLGSGPQVDELERVEDEESKTVVAFIGTVLLFISIVTYGQWILIGVVEEKSSRVVEVVLGAVRPRHLLAGKVVGIGLLGLAQLLLIAGLGVAIVRNTDTFDVPTVGVGLVLIVVGWFLLGFAFFASGFAVAGSLVSRQEDAQNASFPLTLVMLVGYFTATSSLTGGDNPVLRALSMIPPFSPMTMPLRMAAGTAALWEVVLAVVLMLGAIVLMLRIGGRVYSGGLLRTGGKVKVREALRAAER